MKCTARAGAACRSRFFHRSRRTGTRGCSARWAGWLRIGPLFISCTYGAGGTTRTRTIDWCVEIQKRFGLTATSHFTCVEATRDQMEEWLDQATQSGIGNIMALRGDPPDGRKTFEPVPGGFRYANELVAFLRQRHPEIGIGVAGYPEKHQEAPDPQADLEHLKRKVEAGADAVFTQLFYENRSFFDFRDRYRKLGIQVPLIPGIMPITEFARIQRITSLCGATMPVDLAARLEAVRDDRAGPVRDRRRTRRQPVPRAGRGRRAGNPLLRAQSVESLRNHPRRVGPGTGPSLSPRASVSCHIGSGAGKFSGFSAA